MNTKALHKISYGLYLLSASSNGKDNGCIINTAVQLANNPTQISISVIKGSLTNELIASSGKFNISTISESAPYSLFEHFGMQSGRDIDKFSSFTDVNRSENGLYYLTKNSSAFISVKVTNQIELGSHTLFIGEMTDADVLSEENPCTYSYYHSNIKRLPESKEKSGYKCAICGYVYEGDSLPSDFICPLCGHGVEDFEKI